MTATPTGPHPVSRWSADAARESLVLVLAWAVLLLVVITAGLQLTGPLRGSVLSTDNGLERWFVAHRTSTLSQEAQVFTLLGETTTVLVLGPLLLLCIWAWTRALRLVAFLAAALAGEVGVYLVTVNIVSRPRPPVPLLDPGLDPTHSYPSGHVAAATVLYGGVAVLIFTCAAGRWRWLAAPLLVLPPSVAVARLYQGVHHLSDVVTSLTFASIWLAVVAIVLLRGQPARCGEEAHAGS